MFISACVSKLSQGRQLSFELNQVSPAFYTKQHERNQHFNQFLSCQAVFTNLVSQRRNLKLLLSIWERSTKLTKNAKDFQAPHSGRSVRGWLEKPELSLDFWTKNIDRSWSKGKKTFYKEMQILNSDSLLDFKYPFGHTASDLSGWQIMVSRGASELLAWQIRTSPKSTQTRATFSLAFTSSMIDKVLCRPCVHKLHLTAQGNQFKPASMLLSMNF